MTPLAVLVQLVSQTAGRLPWRTSQAVGRGVGSLAWRVSGRDRRRAVEHLGIAFPELDEPARRRLGRECLRHLGCAVLELLHVRRRPPDRVLDHVGFAGAEHLLRLREEKRPILLSTAHCGNWEMISAINPAHRVDLVAMARRMEDPGLADIVVDLRAHLGTRTVHRGEPGASGEIRRALRRSRPMAFLIDQDLRLRGDDCWVPFFGRLAHTPIVVGQLAGRLRDAAVVPTFAERLEDGSHRITFHEPPELPEDPVDATALLTRTIEEQIRRRPEQWVWIHRRWRRRPPTEGVETTEGGVATRRSAGSPTSG